LRFERALRNRIATETVEAGMTFAVENEWLSAGG
jgi:hypothetical protein